MPAAAGRGLVARPPPGATQLHPTPAPRSLFPSQILGSPSVTWPWAQPMLQPAGRPGHGGGQNRPAVGATAGSLVSLPVPGHGHAGCWLGVPAGRWALHEWGGDHPTWGQDGGSRGAQLPAWGCKEARLTAGPLCVCWVVALTPPAPHLSTRSTRLSWREAARVWTAGVGCGRMLWTPDYRVPAHSESSPCAEPRSAGWCKVGAPVSPLTSMTRSAHCPAVTHSVRTPSRQMCRGGGGAIPGGALPCQPGGPRYSRHLLPAPHGRRGGLAHSWRRSAHIPPHSGAWLSHDLATRGCDASVHVRTCA